MRFWDSSAIVPLLVEEAHSTAVDRLLGEDAVVVVWWGSRIECVSALRRRERDGALTAKEVGTALETLGQLATAWQELLPAESVRAAAERALAVHPLRATDALQLSAAQTWRGAVPAAADFVCLDQRLRDAAAREGFRPLPA